MLIWLLSAGNFVIGMGAFMVIGLMPLLAEDLGVGQGRAGTVLTIYALAYAIGSPLLVALTGRVPRRALLAAAMGLFGLAALGAALAPTLPLLLAARVAGALGAGLFSPLAAATAAGLSPPAGRGRALARVFFGLTLAQVIGVPAGAWLAYSLSWHLAFLIVAVLALPVVVGVLRVVPRDLAFQPTTLRGLGAALADLRGLVTTAYTALFLGAVYILFTYIAALLQQQMGYDGSGVSLFLFVFGIGAVGGNLLGGVLADRLGPQRTLTLLAGAQVLLMPLFSLLPMPDALLLSLGLVWSLAGWSFMPSQQMRLIEMAPERQNVNLALNAAAIYAGAGLGGWAGGMVIEAFGLRATGLAAGLAMTLALGNLWLAARLRRRA